MGVAARGGSCTWGWLYVGVAVRGGNCTWR